MPVEGDIYILTFWRVSLSAIFAFPLVAASEIFVMISSITVPQLPGEALRYSASQASRIFWYGIRDRV